MRAVYVRFEENAKSYILSQKTARAYPYRIYLELQSWTKYLGQEQFYVKSHLLSPPLAPHHNVVYRYSHKLEGEHRERQH